MYYIDDYKKRAMDKIVPYLIEFPQVVKIIENNAERYQAIEDILWDIASNFRVEDSRGVFLDAHAHNEVVNIIYTDKADDAFTYGTDRPDKEAYGKGHYYSQNSYISGISKNASEDKTIRSVLAKIIQNNTNCTLSEVKEGIKNLYNTENVYLYESYPLNVNIMLEGKNLELSSSGNYENIKAFLPVCVSLNNIYVNPKTFNNFIYDEKSSYGDSRFPLRIGNTIDIYHYISHCIPLRSIDSEYIITNHNKFDENMFLCITGELENLSDESILLSSSDEQNYFKIKCIHNDLCLEYNNVEYLCNLDFTLNKRFNVILFNNGNELKMWALNSTPFNCTLDHDISYIQNRIVATEPLITVSNFETVNAPMYINCEKKYDEDIAKNFGNVVYYNFIFGNIENNNVICTEYYNTSFGEKQILFNCLENKNHLKIYTNNNLYQNITLNQSYMNYNSKYSNGKYAYFDGKSGIEYNISDLEDNENQIDYFNIEFDICHIEELKDEAIMYNVIGNENHPSYIEIHPDGSLSFEFYTKYIEQGETIYSLNYVYTPTNTININEYCKIRIEYKDGNIKIYKNNEAIYEQDITNNIFGIQKNIKIGYNADLDNFYNGILSSINIDINEEYQLNIPLKYTLNNINNKSYTNSGVRFITVPQLLNDKTNLDLYGNELISLR